MKGIGEYGFVLLCYYQKKTNDGLACRDFLECADIALRKY